MQQTRVFLGKFAALCPAATSGTVTIKPLTRCDIGDFKDATPALVHRSGASGARIRIMDYASQAVEEYLERLCGQSYTA